MFRLSPPKSGMFRLSWPMFRLSRPKSGMFCFCARPMFRLCWPKLGMFRFFLTYVSTFSTKIGYVLFLCSTYVTTLLTEIGYVPVFLDLCFDFLDQNRVCFGFVFVLDLCFDFLDPNWVCFGFLDLCFDCVQPMLWLCSTYFSTVLDLCFDCAGHIFWLSRPKLGMFRLFDLFFDFLDLISKQLSNYPSNQKENKLSEIFLCKRLWSAVGN